MNTDLESLLSTLRDAGPDRPLDRIESQVWARIAERRRRPTPGAIWGWRAAAAACVLVIGAFAADGDVARPASEMALFSTHAYLAPSTLLESRH